MYKAILPKPKITYFSHVQKNWNIIYQFNWNSINEVGFACFDTSTSHCVAIFKLKLKNNEK